MTDFLFSIDAAVFQFINHTLSLPVLDAFFVYITNVKHWMPVYVIFILLLLIRGKKKGRLAVLLSLLMIAITDQTGYRLLKEYFKRPRPFNHLNDVLLPGGPAGTYSFPSNHALNNFAVAVFFSMLYPRYRGILFTIAFLISISRVYIGVHYPSDIVGGALIGAGFGYLTGLLHRYLMKQNIKIRFFRD